MGALQAIKEAIHRLVDPPCQPLPDDVRNAFHAYQNEAANLQAVTTERRGNGSMKAAEHALQIARNGDQDV